MWIDVSATSGVYHFTSESYMACRCVNFICYSRQDVVEKSFVGVRLNIYVYFLINRLHLSP